VLGIELAVNQSFTRKSNQSFTFGRNSFTEDCFARAFRFMARQLSRFCAAYKGVIKKHLTFLSSNLNAI
jgi:hypothetical protein